MVDFDWSRLDLRIFDLAPLLMEKPIIAWSAGAMAIADRVVLFHDSPPQGAGVAELLDFGVGLAPGQIYLPHARHRLRLDDPDRVRLLARRFRPATCVPLDEGDRLERLDGAWHFDRARVIGGDGLLREPREPEAPAPEESR